MGLDQKYGKVTTEFGEIGEDEPVVVFRARDLLLPDVLDYYWDLCETEGSPKHHLNLISSTHTIVEKWQTDHQDEVRVPNSNAYAERFAKLVDFIESAERGTSE